MKTTTSFMTALVFASALSLSALPTTPPMKLQESFQPIPEMQPENAQVAVETFAPMTPDVQPVTVETMSSGKKYFQLPVKFVGTSCERASWDVAVNVDMSSAQSIQFDIFAEDAIVAQQLNIYFHSKNGWYTSSFGLVNPNGWNRVNVEKINVKIEGTPAGWQHIDKIRISAWRANSNADTTLALTNFGMIVEKADIAIIRGDYCQTTRPTENIAFARYAQTFQNTLQKAKIPSIACSDIDVNADTLKKFKLVVLPYNPDVPQNLIDALVTFAKNGGKIIACYSAPTPILDVLQLERLNPGFLASRVKRFGGFKATDQRLKGQPDFVKQDSQFTYAVKPKGKGKVIATWQNGHEKLDVIPAITVTETGAFIGHVWFAGTNDNACRLMLSLVQEFIPIDWKARCIDAYENIMVIPGYGSMDETVKDIQKSNNAQAKKYLQAAQDLQKKSHQAIERQEWEMARELAEQAKEQASCAWFSMQKSTKGEFRAFWCHRPYGNAGASWDDSIKNLTENGFNTIIPNMCWGGVASYPSTILPVHSDVATHGDAVRECLDACKKYGAECHVWKVNWNMGSRSPKDFVEKMVAAKRVQVGRNGKVDERWLCPSHPLNQKLEVDSMIELVKNYPDLHGIHFDYIRYPGMNSCFCDGCRQRFEATLGYTLTEWPINKDAKEWDKWLQFRRDAITVVVKNVYEQAKKINPNIKVSAAVFRHYISDRDRVGQDWKLWCQKGWLDFICPMDYTDFDTSLQGQIDTQKELVYNVPLYPGLGLSCWKNPVDAFKLVKQIDIVRKAGLKGFTVFEYTSSAATSVIKYLKLGCTKDN